MPVEAPCLTFNSQIRLEEFGRLFNRIQAVGFNAYLLLSLMPRCGWRNSNRLPKWNTIELPVQQEADGRFAVRLGDLMKEVKRVVLANLYVGQEKGQSQLCKSATMTQLLTRLDLQKLYQLRQMSAAVPNRSPSAAATHPGVAKYRQTQLAEAKLQQGDRTGRRRCCKRLRKPRCKWETKEPQPFCKQVPPPIRGRPNGCRSQENADCF